MKSVIKNGQWFNSYLCSSVKEVPFEAVMEALDLPSYHTGIRLEDLPEGKLISQVKRQFYSQKRLSDSSYPEDISFDNLKVLDNATRADFSGFWDYPTQLHCYAKLYIDSPEERKLRVKAASNGSLQAWVNRKPAFSLSTILINIETQGEFTLDLEKGENEVVLALTELGERNTQLCFGLCNLDTEDIAISVPITIEPEVVEGLSSLVSNMQLSEASDTLSFKSTPVDFDAQLSVYDGSREKEVISVGRGETEIRTTKPYNNHLITVRACYKGIVLEKKFYRFKAMKPFYPIASTQARRKELYIDALLENANPSPALFIAGLTRNKNLFDLCRKQILDSMDKVAKRADCSDFRLTELIWMYFLGKDILPGDLLDKFARLMLGYRYWFDEKGNDVMWFFSENHALAFHACEFIAGSLFPDKVFSNSGMLGKDHAIKAKGLIRSWFSAFFAYGFNEWSSVNYIPVDMLGFMTLLMFSHDAEIEAYCNQALDYTFRLFALQNHKGMLLGANGRAYPDDLLEPTSIQANAFCYFAWGTSYAPFAYKPTLYALCPHECPADLQDIALWNDKKPMVERFVQGQNSVITTIVKNSGYFFGSSSSPLEGKRGDQEHLIDIMVGDQRGRIWINHPGQSNVFGSSRPGYFNGNGLTPKVSQFLSSAVVSYEFEDVAEVNYTHLVCRLDAFDKVLLQSRCLFLRRGDVNVFIRSDNDIEKTDNKDLQEFELCSKGLKNTWYVRVDDTMDWEDFVKAMKACTYRRNKQVLWVHDSVYGLVKYTLLKPINDKF